VLPTAHAHGDDKLLIEALTEELANTPDADLFIRRGELFRHHAEWARAEVDYRAAAQLQPGLLLVDFFRARMYFESGDASKALTFVDRYLRQVPGGAEGWFLRGEIACALGHGEEAAANYAEGIQRSAEPRPEHFLRRARLLASLPQPDTARILAALDEGVERIGPVISLVDYAVEIDLQRADYDSALRRITRAMASAPRQEAWLVRQGNVLTRSGKKDEALRAYRAALVAITELPERDRVTVPIEKLERAARTALEQLLSPSDVTP